MCREIPKLASQLAEAPVLPDPHPAAPDSAAEGAATIRRTLRVSGQHGGIDGAGQQQEPQAPKSQKDRKAYKTLSFNKKEPPAPLSSEPQGVSWYSGIGVIWRVDPFFAEARYPMGTAGLRVDRRLGA